MTKQSELVIVANRLPVDRKEGPDGEEYWEISPGGLVTAMETVMRDSPSGAWVGWAGFPGEAPEPFDHEGMNLVPVPLTADQIEKYYEGFSNGTLWPLYHDVIASPTFHRTWWDSYVEVNELFAQAATKVAAPGATIWVHDYQLQLVPDLIRRARPDVRIGFFNHIPFPPVELFAQLSKRNQILHGLLGADLIGFQREGDASNFLAATRRLLGLKNARHQVTVPGIGVAATRRVVARSYPISIDTQAITHLAEDESVKARAKQLRKELGNPKKIVLGVDRLDYTKGIRHRIKAYGELLSDGVIDPHEVVMIQIATPSRERVDAYRQLRDEVELEIGRINGDFAPIGRPAISYMHRSFDRREMTALYKAADVLLVTALRDGMNLVAKEYVASRSDLRGVLVLSEFAGAADELRAAIPVNPHDIDELKTAIVDALGTSNREQATRMRSLRRQVLDHDVQSWAKDFLGKLDELTDDHHRDLPAPIRLRGADAPQRGKLREAIERFSRNPRILVASDVDGVLAPIVTNRSEARPRPESMAALAELAQLEGVNVAMVSGRSLDDLDSLVNAPDSVVLIGSHGAEVGRVPADVQADVLDLDATRLTDAQRRLLRRVQRGVEGIAQRYPGTEVEYKPAGVVLHTRRAQGRIGGNATTEALDYARNLPDVKVTPGKRVVEFSVVDTSKGRAISTLRRATAADAVIYVGDDVTDEQAFATLDEGDLGIKVGDGDTSAEYRVADPEQVTAVFERLLSARERLGRRR